MSVTDEAFWEELYDKYVEEWVDEDFSFEDKQGLVAEDGVAKDKLHTSIFNRINEAAKLPQNRDIGYFKNTRKHGMVKNKDKFAKIAQKKLETFVAEEEKKRIGVSVKKLTAPKSIRATIQSIRIVTETGRKEEERVRAGSFRREGLLASSFIAEIRGEPSRADAIIKQAQNEISGAEFERVRRAADIIKRFGVVGEV